MSEDEEDEDETADYSDNAVADGAGTSLKSDVNDINVENLNNPEMSEISRQNDLLHVNVEN